jgi:hypothetical protein
MSYTYLFSYKHNYKYGTLFHNILKHNKKWVEKSNEESVMLSLIMIMIQY